jgi:hypothetical protein
MGNLRRRNFVFMARHHDLERVVYWNDDSELDERISASGSSEAAATNGGSTANEAAVTAVILSTICAKLDALQQTVNNRFDRLESRLDGSETRLERLERMAMTKDARPEDAVTAAADAAKTAPSPCSDFSKAPVASPSFESGFGATPADAATVAPADDTAKAMSLPISQAPAAAAGAISEAPAATVFEGAFGAKPAGAALASPAADSTATPANGTAAPPAAKSPAALPAVVEAGKTTAGIRSLRKASTTSLTRAFAHAVGVAPSTVLQTCADTSTRCTTTATAAPLMSSMIITGRTSTTWTRRGAGSTRKRRAAKARPSRPTRQLHHRQRNPPQNPPTAPLRHLQPRRQRRQSQQPGRSSRPPLQ